MLLVILSASNQLPVLVDKSLSPLTEFQLQHIDLSMVIENIQV